MTLSEGYTPTRADMAWFVLLILLLTFAEPLANLLVSWMELL